MALDFPSSPALNDTYTEAGKTWRWNGTGWQLVTAGTVTNTDVAADAGIVDTKLATIATAGKVSNSATTAASANTASAIVARDASGNFSAGTITANLTGTASAIADNTVTSAKIVDGTIVNADINASAAIAGTKISPDFGSQNVVTTGDTQTASINGGPLAGMRNAIINGNFDIWQRGTSSTTATNGFFTADRWGIFSPGGTGRAVTYSQQTFDNGQTEVPGNPKYFFRWDETTAGTSYTVKELYQGIEGVQAFAGQQVTLSFYAKATSAITLLFVGFEQYFGAGGSPSATVFTTLSSSQAITTSWARYTYTFTMPSISGKTIGTNGDDATFLEIDLPNTGTFTFDIAQVQVEAGPVATTFEKRPIGTELALCQRYYETGNYLSNYFYTSSWQPDDKFEHVSFKVSKRGIPTIGGTFTGAGWTGTWSTASVTDNGFRFGNNATTNSGSFTHQADWTATAEL
jgi:hypothetical protein